MNWSWLTKITTSLRRTGVSKVSFSTVGLFLYVLLIGFLALPNITVNGLQLPEQYTQDFLPDMEFGYGLGTMGKFTLSNKDISTKDLRYSARIIQERLGQPLLQNGFFNVRPDYEKKSLIVTTGPSAEDYQNYVLLTTQGDTQLVISKDTAATIDTGTNPQYYQDPANFTATGVGKSDIQNLFLRKDNRNPDYATHYFVMTFTESGVRKMTDLLTDDNQGKALLLQIDESSIPIGVVTNSLLAENALSFPPPYQISEASLIALLTTPSLPAPLSFTDVTEVKPWLNTETALRWGMFMLITIVVLLLIGLVWQRSSPNDYLTNTLLLLQIPALSIVTHKFTHLPFSILSWFLLFCAMLTFVGIALRQNQLKKEKTAASQRRWSYLVTILSTVTPGIILLLAHNPWQTLGQNLLLVGLILLMSLKMREILIQNRKRS